MTNGGCMKSITVDFETYYDADFSLGKLMTAEYVRDSRFEVIGVGISANGNDPVWLSGTVEQIRSALQKIDWSKTRVMAHNAIFDGAILEWIFDCHPAKYLCTMMGSRPHIVPYTGSMGLADVAEYLNVGQKGAEVQNHKGRRRVSFTAEQLDSYGAYCKQDVALCTKIGKYLDGILPDDEKDLIDLTIKKFTRPVLLLDQEAMTAREETLKATKALVMASVQSMGVTVSSLRSRPQFKERLAKLGVVLSKKATVNSKGESTVTDAMSKKDPEFLELLVHDDPRVRLLCAAKIELGSTIEESRLARFRRLYNSQPGHVLPIPLLYYGAHPGRFSGMDGLNMQNLPRARPDDPERAALRKSIVAPPGWMIIAADYSNIEARIVATLAGQWDLVEAFLSGVDVYSQFASRMYKRPINKKDHPVARFVGKTCILGLGYGMGGKKLRLTLATADTPVHMSLKETTDAVYLYRNTYEHIPALWGRLEGLVKDYVLAPSGLHTWGPLTFAHERIILPNGMPIIYHKIRHEVTGGYGNMRYSDNKQLWGGSITENVVQALARIIATRAELRLAKAGLRAVHQAHDELIFCVPIEHVDACEKAIARVMTDPVPWMPKLPIAVEIHHGPTYGDCK